MPKFILLIECKNEDNAEAIKGWICRITIGLGASLRNAFHGAAARMDDSALCLEPLRICLCFTDSGLLSAAVLADRGTVLSSGWAIDVVTIPILTVSGSDPNYRRFQAILNLHRDMVTAFNTSMAGMKKPVLKPNSLYSRPLPLP